MKTIIITGGAGFIGSALVRHLIANTDVIVINVDKLTYAGNLESLGSATESDNYIFEKVDICDASEVKRILSAYEPDAVINLAAESHVDRSIDSPADFIQTNIVGTYVLLDAAREYWRKMGNHRRDGFRFLHVSTDEVFGSLSESGQFVEESRYQPNSPYSASKAAADHLARSWHHTYGFPILISNCSNNYGPYQYPEKFIPVMILNALDGKALPVYGKGDQVRDWLYVNDHVSALCTVLKNGKPGEMYNIGGNNERSNIEVVTAVCELLDKMVRDHPSGVQSYAQLITHVEDRPGHDKRYSINADKIRRDLGWAPTHTFDQGLKKTVTWYLDNLEWCRIIEASGYQRERLGLIKKSTP